MSLRRAMIMMKEWMVDTGATARSSTLRRISQRLQSLPAPPSSTPPDVAARWSTADAWASVAYQTKWEDPKQGIKTRPTCEGKGCWGCCRGIVSVAPGEVEAIAPHLTQAQVDAVMAHAPADPVQAMCPLLGEDKACGIYAVRPTVCRSYMVITPRDDCYPEITGPGRRVASPCNDVLVELLQDVMLNPDERGFIPALQDALRRQGRA